ncbi:MAG: AAA family ATPase [Ktedonobacteraceae bacterium]|nr:AAA family ATPase [Ktedonobacteraceae bacterium]
MTTITSEIRIQAIDQPAPATQDVLHRAQQEAARLQATEISPELLLLGTIWQGHSGVRKVLHHLGINWQTMRTQAAQIFALSPGTEQTPASPLPLSQEAQNCVERAISFATSLHAPALMPEHLLLGTLPHPRIQPLLALLLPDPNEGIIPAPVIESTGRNYSSAMEQFIHSRIREQSVVDLDNRRALQILRSFERPTTLFTDIKGEDNARHLLQEAVTFLSIPRAARYRTKDYLYGSLLVGSPRRNRPQMTRALAGEAAVPLLSLSLSTLADMLKALACGSVQLEDFDLSDEEQRLLAHKDIAHSGRAMIRYLFDQAREVAPCVLLLDDFEALDRLPSEQERQQWLNQILVEMDRREFHPPLVVIAATEHPGNLAQVLLHPTRFRQRVVLEDSILTQARLCPACHSTVQAGWKYCMYCGTPLAKACPQCHALLPEIEEARFCCECGSTLR